MEQLSEKKRELYFLNDGDADLLVKGITTNCSCTPVLLSKERIRPGEEGTVSVTLSTTMESGRVEGSFLIHTNDPVQPSARILLDATVEPVYEVDPEIVNFGVYYQGDPEKTITIKIEPKTVKGLNIESAVCSSQFITVLNDSWEFNGERAFYVKVGLSTTV